MGHTAEAQESFRKVLAISERLARDNPTVTQYQSGLAMSHITIGLLLVGAGRRVEALESFRRAVAINERLARDYPLIHPYRQLLIYALAFLGKIHQALDHPDDANRAARDALALAR